MNIPDTFAGGTFNLPLKVAKIVRLAEGTQSTAERESAIRKLWSFDYFLDRAGVLWEKDKVPEFAKDDLYKELSENDPELAEIREVLLRIRSLRDGTCSE